MVASFQIKLHNSSNIVVVFHSSSSGPIILVLFSLLWYSITLAPAICVFISMFSFGMLIQTTIHGSLVFFKRFFCVVMDNAFLPFLVPLKLP